jgi:hypothetical protein
MPLASHFPYNNVIKLGLLFAYSLSRNFLYSSYELPQTLMEKVGLHMICEVGR